MTKKDLPDSLILDKIKDFENYNNLLKEEVKILNEMLLQKSGKRSIQLTLEDRLEAVRIKKTIYNTRVEIKNKEKFIARFYKHANQKQL